MFVVVVSALLLVFVELMKLVRDLIWSNDLEDKLDQLLSGLIVGFNWHLEELKLMLQLCSFYPEGMCTVELSSRHLINLVPLRNELPVWRIKLQGYCNKHYDSLKTKLLFMKIRRNELPVWRIKQIPQPINPNILSLSTRLISSYWYDQLPLKVEDFTLNITRKNYTLPHFIKQMGQLKVLSITNHTDYPSKLHNLSLLHCLSNLRSLKFEHVSVPSIQPVLALKNLKQLSFVMCEINDALMSYSHTAQAHDMLPNLTDLEIDMCYDLKELPSNICNLVNLQKLSITNCHELDVLPKGLGSLLNLETLNLHCCTKLQELPDSIGSLCNLRFIDVSDCLNISVLPEEIGELCGLRVIKMNGCGGLQELPMSMSALLRLEEVICDEETSYLWMEFESDLHNLK